MKDYTFPNTLFLTRLKRKSIPLSVFLCLCFHVFVLNSELFSQSQTLFYRAWNQSSSAVRPEFTNHVVTAVNSSNQTYIAGSTLNTSNTHSLQLTKLLSNGSQSWQTQFTVNTGGDVYVAAIALDGSGNILVTGSAYNGSTNNYDLFLVKFNSSGVKQWHVLYNGSGNSYDSGAALVCGSSNEVYVTGATWSSATYIDVVTLAYNSSGLVIWSQTFNNASLTDVGGTIAVSGSEVLVTGFTQTSATNWEFLGLSYQKSNGTFNGSKITNSGGSTIDRITSAAVDASGNIYITGSLGGSGTGLNVKTVKLDPALNILWTATWNGAANQDDTGRRIAVDGSGNVFITGYTTVSGKRDALLLKYTSSGTLSFANTFDGAEGDAEFQDLVVSSSGNVFVGGYTTKKGNKDFYAAYYSNSGTLIWSEAYNGPYNGNDEIQQVIADGTDGYIVAGPSVGIGTGGPDVVANARTIKYTKHNWVKTSEEKGNGPFIENRGQVINTDGTTENNVRYYTRNTYPYLYLSNSSISYVYAHIDTIPSTQDTMVRLDLSFPTNYSRPNIACGLEEQDYFNNYYLGHIPEGREQVPSNNKILYPNLYPNMDAAFGQGLDGMFMRFTLKSGSSSSDLKLEFNGKTAISVLSNGNLKVETILEDLELPKPTAALVNSEGAETPITAWAPAYTIGSDGKVSITTGAYDTTKTLVIKIGRDRGDQNAAEFWWSTYYGWTDLDMEAAVDCDDQGFVYTCGRSWSINFPVGNTELSPMGQSDWTVNKFNLAGEPQWFVMVGGQEGGGDFRERSHDISVGNSNSPFLYVGGFAASQWNDIFNNPLGSYLDDNFDESINLGRGAIIKLRKKDGVLRWATFFGDAGKFYESILGVEALENGGVVATGYSKGGAQASQWQNISPGSNAHQSTIGDMYIGEFDENNGLSWATKFGPSNNTNTTSNAPTDIVEDANGNFFVVGVIFGDETNNDEFPTGGGTSINNGPRDGFVAKFDVNRDLVWSSYLGGTNKDYCSGIISDHQTNDIVVYGTTESSISDGFPINGSGNSLLDDGSLGGTSDLFLARFSNTGTLLHSRYFGGDAKDFTDPFELGENIGTFHPSNGIATDFDGNLFITGSAGSGLPVIWPDPIKPWYFPNFKGGGTDGFVAALASNFKVEYCTYLGSSNEDNGTGVAVYTDDSPSRHNILMVGRTRGQSNDYPTAFETQLTYYENVYLGGQFDGVISNIKTNSVIVKSQDIEKNALTVMLYPNPTADLLTIKIMDLDFLSSFQVLISDMSGKELIRTFGFPGQSQVSIKTNMLPSGAYVITLKSFSSVWSKMFIKK